MRDLLWRPLVWLVTWAPVFAWLQRRGAANPYTHITSADGQDTYMFRYWIFNPFGKDAEGDPLPARWSWLPSVRLHRIMRGDHDRHLHDHPWNARTIVLRGFYADYRNARCAPLRQRGYTGRLLFGQFHRILYVNTDGVWTLFFTWKYRGTWGFDVDGVKVPWREYLGIK